MKAVIALLLLILIAGCTEKKGYDRNQSKKNKRTPDSGVYKIILKTYESQPMGEADSIQLPGEIDTVSITKLSEPLRALAAFYSAIGGTNCSDSSCDLITALGLGKQGSDLQEELIRNYFPNDTIATCILSQNCTVGKDGSSFFSDFEYLTLIDKGDTVKVDYDLAYQARENVGQTIGTDVYLFRNNKFLKIRRSIWNEIDN